MANVDSNPTLLLGPAPCDTCRNVPRCRQTGAACLAFNAYYNGKPEGTWRLQPTQPRLDIGARLGFYEPPEITDEMIDAAMSDCGTQRKAAEALGTHPQKIRMRIDASPWLSARWPAGRWAEKLEAAETAR